MSYRKDDLMTAILISRVVYSRRRISASFVAYHVSAR
jgi:hypothetical protein